MKVLFACFLLLFAYASAQDLECDPSLGEYVTCAVCESDLLSAANDIETIPRIGPSGFTPSQLGWYDINVDDINTEDFSEKSIMAYVIGVASIAAIMITMGLWCQPCCCFWFCCCRFCCCCISGGGCGSRYPTRKKKSGLTGGLGFVQDSESKYGFAYSKTERYGAMAFTSFFVFMLLLWICQGQWSGNDAFPGAAKAVLDSPQGLVDFAQGLSTPLENMMINAISGPIAELFVDIDYLVFDTFSVPMVISNLTCMLDVFGNMPEPENFAIWINDTQAISNNISADLESIPEIFTAFDDNFLRSFDTFDDSMNELEYDFYVTELAINSSLSNLTLFDSDIVDVDADIAAVDVDGLTALTLEYTGTDAGMPRDELVDRLTVDGDSSLHDLLAPLTMNITERVTILSRLTEVQTALNTLPDYDAVADSLDAFNTMVDLYKDEIFPNYAANLNSTWDQVNTLAHVDDTMTNIFNNLTGESLDLDFPALRETLISVNESQFSINFTTLYAEIDKIQNLENIVPCSGSISFQFRKINDSLFELPPELKSVFDLLDSINGTVQDMTESVLAMKADIEEFESSRNATNINRGIVDIDNMEAEFTNESMALNDSFIEDTLPYLTNISTLIQELDLSNNITTFNQTLYTNRLNETQVSLLRSFGNFLTSILGKIDVLVADLGVLADGTCAIGGAACTTDAECPSTCTAAAQTCQVDTVTLCTEDADCPGDRCLMDDDRVNDVITNITALTANSPGKIQPIQPLELADRVSVTDEEVSNENSLLWQVQLIAIRASLRAMNFSSTSTGVVDALNEFDGKGLQDDFNSTASELKEVDWNNTLSNIDSFSDSVNETNAVNSSLVVSKEMMEMFLRMHNDKVPEWVAEVDVELLESIREEGSIVNVLDHVAGLLDNITMWFEDNSELFTNFSSNFRNESADLQDTIRALVTDEESRHGPIHFLAYLSGQELTDPESPNAERLNVGADGELYEDNVSCYSKTCLSNEIEFRHKAPLTETSDGKVPLDLSVRQVIAVPYIFPFLVMVIALVAMLVPKLAILNYVNYCFMNCQMPCQFILGGAAFTLLVVVPGDLCLGLENAGYKIMVESDNDFCTDTLNFTGDVYGCVVPLNDWLPFGDNTTNSTTNYNVTVNLAGIYTSVFGKTCSSTNDPVYDMFESFADIADTLLVELVDPMVESGSPFTLREPLLDVFHNATEDTGELMSAFVLDFGVAFGCDGLKDVFSNVQDAFCCDVLSAVYWALGSWCLIAWTLCLCGGPAAILGRKRFASRPWGPIFNEARREAHANGQLHNFTAIGLDSPGQEMDVMKGEAVEYSESSSVDSSGSDDDEEEKAVEINVPIEAFDKTVEDAIDSNAAAVDAWADVPTNEEEAQNQDDMDNVQVGLEDNEKEDPEVNVPLEDFATKSE